MDGEIAPSEVVAALYAACNALLDSDEDTFRAAVVYTRVPWSDLQQAIADYPATFCPPPPDQWADTLFSVWSDVEPAGWMVRCPLWSNVGRSDLEVDCEANEVEGTWQISIYDILVP